MANIKYNKTIEKKILERLCNGESIRKICKDPEMDTYSSGAAGDWIPGEMLNLSSTSFFLKWDLRKMLNLFSNCN